MLKGNRPNRGQGQYGPSAEAPINTDDVRNSAVEMAKRALQNAGIDESSITTKWREGGKVFEILDNVSARADIAQQMVSAQMQMQEQQAQAMPVQQAPIQQTVVQQVPMQQVNPVAFEYQQVQQAPPPVQMQQIPPEQPVHRDGLSMQSGPRPSDTPHITPPPPGKTIFSNATSRINGRGAGRYK